ncbi:hypothetical protein H5T88_02335 [bacterium]|nr:hypothetical protein [bacterium]
MKVSKPVLYSRLFLEVIIVALGIIIVKQAFLLHASTTYLLIGIAVIAYGIFRLYGTLILLLRGKRDGG